MNLQARRKAGFFVLLLFAGSDTNLSVQTVALTNGSFQ